MVEPVSATAAGGVVVGSGLIATIIGLGLSVINAIGNIISTIITADKRLVYLAWIGFLILDSVIESITYGVVGLKLSIGSTFGGLMFFAFGVQGISSASILLVSLLFSLIFVMYFFMAKTAETKTIRG